MAIQINLFIDEGQSYIRVDDLIIYLVECQKTAPNLDTQEYLSNMIIGLSKMINDTLNE